MKDGYSNSPLIARRALLRMMGVGAGVASGIGLVKAQPQRASPGTILTRVAQGARERYGILGQMAPDIAAEFWIDPAGKPTTFDMASVRGKWVYLKCFQSWCPGCHRYGFPALKKVADAFRDEDRFVALGVQTVFEGFGVNSGDKVREIQLQYQLPITMGHDPGSQKSGRGSLNMRRFRTGGTPWVVIINPSGQVVYNDYHVNAEKLIDYLHAKFA